eukprot:CAMPEP_0197290980 /NCGR_PEP_ID=MMETSP0890-20130614/10413_1 /TAXON_ID=44058 ORGANISM="Aureoumbra lagunensis, Strain CCMP1510" /NCGR_SAMPLE_ID=MMETSP0890 /ASSEMBLY_ACC=CAM_ASM_000533 /LENGTH=443 /DNA_ID=CAMNT_0042763405 /DNA_START=196 /DNA_END=1527 /DNA_ORIENTATION=-
MARGAWVGILKDTTSLAKLKADQQVTLMGTAEVLVEKEQPKFVEDMAEEEVAKSGAVLPAGLQNLGNTCYMNSTVQCLRAVPELRQSLEEYNGAGSSLTGALHHTYNRLDASTKPIMPSDLILTLRATFPQFAEKSRNGQGFAQQDAEELLATLFAELSMRLTQNNNNTVDTLFGIDLQENLSCAETQDEPPVIRQDKARKLVCNIQGGHGASTKIDHLHEGIKIGLSGTLEKRSDILGRNAIWNKTQTIVKLPPYLCIQFMRFFWKPTPNNDDHQGVKCKIMRPVSFPETFDVFDYCQQDLQKELKFNRDAYGAKLDQLPTSEKDQDGDTEMSGQDDTELAKAIALSMTNDTNAVLPPDFTQHGLPAQFLGEYEIFAVVTHKGRSADGGHYMGWVRQDKDKWLVFDDDIVTESSTEFVVNNLKGGGDEHMAYLAFYRAKAGR